MTERGGVSWPWISEAVAVLSVNFRRQLRLKIRCSYAGARDRAESRPTFWAKLLEPLTAERDVFAGAPIPLDLRAPNR